MTNETMPNPYTARFKHFLARSAIVARQRIEAESVDSPISDEARERAQNVLSYALKESETWAATSDLLLTLAPKMEMAGHRDGWIQYLQEGLAQSQHQHDRLTEAALQFQCGYLYRLMSNYEKSHRLLRASAAHYAALGDTQNQARALNQLAYLAWQQHRYDEAENLVDEALNLLSDKDSERAVGMSALGLVAFNRRQWHVAENYHRTALRIYRERGDQRRTAWSLQNLGDTLRAQGNYEAAASYLEEAIAILAKVHDPAHQAIAQMNLGIVYSVSQETPKALVMYERAELIFRQTADELNLAKMLTCKGIDFLTLEKWQQAEGAFVASTTLFQKLDDHSEYLNAFDGLGLSYLGQGLYDKALEIFETVLVQLPQIQGTRAYVPLTMVINSQIERARQAKGELITTGPPES